ncbi:MAG: sialate O-acetylesterase [Bacteroidales bacterium]
MKFHIGWIFFMVFVFAVNVQAAKLFLVAGQSNAVGQGTSTLSTVCTSGTAFEYNALTNSVQHLQDPMGQSFDNLEPALTGSIGLSFAQTLNSLINEPIYMVSAARGGSSNCVKAELSSYGTWDDTGTKILFGSAVNKVQNAMKTTGLPLSGIIWIQGERDANAIKTLTETEAEYRAALEKLIARFRGQFGSNLPFYIVLTGLQGVVTKGVPVATDTQSNYAVRTIQRDIAKKTPNVFVAFSSTDKFFDQSWMKPEAVTVHYIQTAYNQIGDSVARLVATIPYDASNYEPFSTPNSANLKIIVDNMDAACTFDAPWPTSVYAPGYYGSNYTQDGSATANPDKWAKWAPNIPGSGTYRVYMQWTSGAGRPTVAPVEIQSADSVSHLTIDQSINGGKWNYLGAYNFSQGNTGYVKLLASAVGSTIADAVLFEQIKLDTSVKELIDAKDILSVKTINGGDLVRITIKLKAQCRASLTLYSSSGAKIKQFIENKDLSESEYSFSVNATKLSKGVYFAKLNIGNSSIITKRLIVD